MINNLKLIIINSNKILGRQLHDSINICKIIYM